MTTDAPDPDMTAAELALGLLDGEERAAALRRVLADPVFAREVEDWRRRLAGLFDDYPEVAAPESVADRLIAPEAPAVARPRSAFRWPIAAMVGAIAAMLALFVRFQPAPRVEGPPHHMMVASLMMSDKSSAVPAMVDMTTGEMRIGETGMAPQGKTAQLWMIGGDGVPRSMGMLASTGPSRMMLPMEKRRHLKTGMMLAVSIEPLGGSPTGLPTGPVVASGKLSVA
ncbi:MAG: anti-sigma factor [Sphingomonas sp.]|uniref:anti-sigma factor n=1 Tax=Sphingomonas sp. TaxID=28214 RepID=UPI003F7F9ABA